jgi:predicted transcriptional regulator
MRKGLLMDNRNSKEEERLTREALADVDDGRVVGHEAVLAWAESLGTGHPLSAPCLNIR